MSRVSRRLVMTVCLVLAHLAVLATWANAAQLAGRSPSTDVPLSGTTPVDGKHKLLTAPGTTVLGSVVQNAYAFPGACRDYDYLINRSYSLFRAELAFDDHAPHLFKKALKLRLDGEEVVLPEVVPTSGLISIQVDVRNRARITFRIEGIGDNNWKFFRIINPRFATSDIVQPERVIGQDPSKGSQEAPFVVDPNDLEKLAVALRKRVDAKPEFRQKVAHGRIALTTFTLTDIPSDSVAGNVAEDLYTSLINNDFPLAERGQLDKLLKELKIQDTALIDEKTAQKLGKLSGCDMILFGNVSDRGAIVVINARLMETTTGRSIVAERVEMRKIPIERK